jgi:hypothetical protein
MGARIVLALTLLAGCASGRGVPAEVPPAPSTVTAPSELPPGGAMTVALATLRREGWPFSAATATTLTTGWRETVAGPVRLFVTASEVDGGASTVLSVWGETQAAGGAAVPIVRPGPAGGPGREAWAVVETAARQVEAEVRYARP